MSWNYRVVKRLIKEKDFSEYIYGIHECYSDGRHSTDPEMVEDASIEDLRWQLTEMLKALDKPIIDGGDYALPRT